MVRVTVLGSGSRGNCTVVSSSRTRILVDAGLSCRETVKRMRQAGEDPAALTAILISHEHGDHIHGLRVLARKLRVPVYITQPTHRTWMRALRQEAKPVEDAPADLERKEFFDAGRSFQIGDIAITPFTIPHDAADPVGFTFRSNGAKMAIVTDLGYMPELVKVHLRDADCLVLESNHDLEMLKVGPYPWVVKQRVLSRTGHLSNHAVSEYLSDPEGFDGRARYLVMAHISQENNNPDVVKICAEQALQKRPSEAAFSGELLLASQHLPLKPMEL